MTNNVETLVIDNFKGNFTEFTNGDINSGMTNILNSFGYDSFKKPGQLTWGEDATQIDAAGSVITDLILDGKERVESGITYIYAIGHTGRLYKIQVNDPTTFNPNYDNPVLLATLSAQTPTFTRGGYIEFYGSTERIYIGHDKGVTRIDFDGTNETFVGAVGTWTQTVPRSLQQFIGNLYIGNGENIAEIDSTATVTTYTKLSPALPKGTQVRDLDSSVDGNYLQIVVSRLALADITSATQDTTLISNVGSRIVYWNGIDAGATSQVQFPLVNMSANQVSGEKQFLFGLDLRGTMFYDGVRRISAAGGGAPFGEPPFPNAVNFDGEMISFATTLYYNGFTELSHCVYGTFDEFVGNGYWSPFGMTATGTETDILHVPYWQIISNFNQGLSSNGYTDNIFGNSKVYFSTLETSSTPTTAYKFYKWNPVNTGQGTAASYSYYQTQTQLFSKKITVKEVRIYGEPWVANNAFTVDLIGSSGLPITNGTKTFTAGTELTVGNDYVWWNPQIAPTYALSFAVSNAGSVNHVINKIEVDYAIGGK